MTNPVPLAQSIACQRCGGAVPVTGARQATCPYCEHVQAIPRQVIASLERYQADAARLVSRIDSERGRRAKWEFWYGKDGKARHAWVFPIVLFVVIGIVTAVGLLLLNAHVIDEHSMGAIMTPGILGAYVLGFVVYGLVLARKKSNKTTLKTRVNAQCPLCGGVLPFEFGALARACPHCGGLLAPDEQVANQALGEAEFELQLERMSRYRLERTTMSRLYRTSASNIVVYIVLGSLLPATAGGAIICTYQYLAGSEADATAGAVVLLWAMALLNAGILLGIYRLRARRRKRYRAIAQFALAYIRGSLVTRTSDWVIWLNTYWAGPYPIEQLHAGPYFHGVTGTLSGYPIAFDLDPVPADSEHGKPRVAILLAACLPPELESLAVAPELQQRAQAIGFSLQSNSGGFRAEALHAPTLLKTDPTGAAEALVVAANLLLECASHAHTPPGLAIPAE